MTKSNLEILAYEESPLGPLCLRRRKVLSLPGTVVTEVTLNHEFLMSSLYTDSERELSRIAIEANSGSKLKVLVGGLGLGYTARASLESDRVSHVEVVELLPQVITWLEQGLVPLSNELRDEPRLEVHQGDIYGRLAAAPNLQFDVILIDVDHSPDERLGGENESFYSADGLRAAKEHLSSGGVMGIWSYAESSPFADTLRTVFREVQVEPVTYNNEMIDEERTDWLFFAQD